MNEALLLDMNLSPRWLSVLTEAGFDAVHWSTLGKRDAADTEIMAFAKANDYVVLTHDPSKPLIEAPPGALAPHLWRRGSGRGSTFG